MIEKNGDNDFYFPYNTTIIIDKNLNVGSSDLEIRVQSKLKHLQWALAHQRNDFHRHPTSLQPLALLLLPILNHRIQRINKSIPSSGNSRYKHHNNNLNHGLIKI